MIPQLFYHFFTVLTILNLIISFPHHSNILILIYSFFLFTSDLIYFHIFIADFR